MIIYNTTYCVAEKRYADFVKWLKEKHLPQVLSTDFFVDAKMARVLSAEEQDGISLSLQLTAPDLDAVYAWQDQYGSRYRSEISLLFAEDVLGFATFMEILD